MRKLWVVFLAVTFFITCGFAQKVKVGYDKSVDFSKYKSYTWHEPGITQNRPLLYVTVVGSIRSELEAKGLVSVEKDGDLTLIADGGLDYGLKSDPGLLSDSCSNCQKPAVDARVWAGSPPPSGSSGMPLPKGVLELQLVDRTTNKVVWTGMVMQKLDPDKKQQALERVNAAIKKLLMEFPPKK